MNRKFKIDVQEHGEEFSFWVWIRDDSTAWRHVASGLRLTHEAALTAARDRANLWLAENG